MNAVLGIVHTVSIEPFALLAAIQPDHGAIGGVDPLFWAIVALNGLPWLVKIPVAIAHIVLAIAVLRDRRAARSPFVPHWAWFLVVLSSGFVGLLAYWLMHDTQSIPDHL